VTEPDELAIGLAVALTPPTPSARAVPLGRKVKLPRIAAAVVLYILLAFLKPLGITG
tara:strand:- start:1736 stop:1906 length:171 start_codon:yes stop_codon:yes gene_type:complete